MTFNAYIKSKLTEALEPYGFIRIKGKYPYWIRMECKELVQVVSYKNERSAYVGCNDFSIIGGIATIYRDKIELDINPRDQRFWMVDARECYKLQHADYRQLNEKNRWYNNDYLDGNEESMIDRVNNAIEILINYYLKEILNVDDMKKCIEFYNIYSPGVLNNIFGYYGIGNLESEDEGINLFGLITKDAYAAKLKEGFNKLSSSMMESVKKDIEKNPQNTELFYKKISEIETQVNNSINIYGKIIDDEVKLNALYDYKEKCKKRNIEYLKNKGIDQIN